MATGPSGIGIHDKPSTFAFPRCPVCGSEDRRPVIAAGRAYQPTSSPGARLATERRQRALLRLLWEAWPYNVEATDLVAAVEGSPLEIGACLRRMRELDVVVKEPQEWPRWRSRWALSRGAAQALWLAGVLGGRDPSKMPVIDVLNVR